MRLNTIKPAQGEKQSPKRVGRGIGSGLGKTCGRGHKGQSARAGGFHKVGFEGGQMPMQRRLPKIGFASLGANKTAELTLGELAKIGANGAIIEGPNCRPSDVPVMVMLSRVLKMTSVLPLSSP